MKNVKKPNFGESEFSDNAVISGSENKKPEIRPLRIATLLLNGVHIDVKIEVISRDAIVGSVVGCDPTRTLPPELSISDKVEFSVANIFNIKDL